MSTIRTPVAIAFLWMLPQAGNGVVPLPRAHAHNDYLHRRPLADALAHGFCSVEADIHLRGDQLFVAHEKSQIRKGRTLRKLYLDPLRKRVRANGGRVYRNGPKEIILLIDIKSDKRATWNVLRKTLREYREVLTRWQDGKKFPGAISAILSGGMKRELLEAEEIRYCALDGSYDDASPYLSPLCSRPWRREFRWNGKGTIPADELTHLKKRVRQVHAQGRRLRYWGVANRHAVWRVLYDAGVDLIHTDNLRGVRDFLLERRVDLPKKSRERKGAHRWPNDSPQHDQRLSTRRRIASIASRQGALSRLPSLRIVEPHRRYVVRR